MSGKTEHSDRELLELAAKAAGIDPRLQDVGGWCGMHWNPLADDGDNRRLQVKLRFGLIPIEGGGWDVTRYDSESCEEIVWAWDADDKRAIVRAAVQFAKATATGA